MQQVVAAIAIAEVDADTVNCDIAGSSRDVDFRYRRGIDRPVDNDVALDKPALRGHSQAACSGAVGTDSAGGQVIGGIDSDLTGSRSLRRERRNSDVAGSRGQADLAAGSVDVADDDTLGGNGEIVVSAGDGFLHRHGAVIAGDRDVAAECGIGVMRKGNVLLDGDVAVEGERGGGIGRADGQRLDRGGGADGAEGDIGLRTVAGVDIEGEGAVERGGVERHEIAYGGDRDIARKVDIEVRAGASALDSDAVVAAQIAGEGDRAGVVAEHIVGNRQHAAAGDAVQRNILTADVDIAIRRGQAGADAHHQVTGTVVDAEERQRAGAVVVGAEDDVAQRGVHIGVDRDVIGRVDTDVTRCGEAAIGDDSAGIDGDVEVVLRIGCVSTVGCDSSVGVDFDGEGGGVARIGISGHRAGRDSASAGADECRPGSGNVADVDVAGAQSRDRNIVTGYVAVAGDVLVRCGCHGDIVGGVEGAGKDDGCVDGVEVEEDVAGGQGGAGQGDGQASGIDQLDIAVERGGRADDQGIVHVDGAGGGLGE